MQLQGRNLTERLRGDDVALLHEELGQLDFTIDRAEVADKRFGTSTREAVLVFQRRHRLEATGVVDAISAGKETGTGYLNLPGRPRVRSVDSSPSLVASCRCLVCQSEERLRFDDWLM
ncbi:MAG: peptidoglycan-binding protein [Nitrospiraceae bacterium]